ncbi:MAG: DUF4388 domain-containing protein [Myxococcota bacterium]|nr:DUF4388 domain-containing protein [Myxococcota bacterium]
MSLKGKLEDFGFADILQLLGNQKKTGILALKGRRGSPAVKLHFKGGSILRVDTNHRERSALLGERLVRQGLLERGDLETSLKSHKKSKVSIGQVLIDQELVEEHLIQQTVNLQAREVLFQLFTWAEGEYHFESSLTAVDAVVTPISSEALLMEGFRLMDEWPLVRARINDYNMVYQLNRGIDESATGPLSEKSILVARHIDGQRRVVALIERSGLGEFETCKALSALLSHGYIVPTRVRRLASTKRPGPSISFAARMVFLLKNLGMLAGACAITWYAYLSHDGFSTMDLPDTVKAEINNPRVLYAQLRQALEIYRIEHGRYPESIGDLATLGIFHESVLTGLKSAGVSYLTVGDDYELGYRESL